MHTKHHTNHFSSMISKSFSSRLPRVCLINSRGPTKSATEFPASGFCAQHFGTVKDYMAKDDDGVASENQPLPDNVKTLVTMTSRENRQSTPARIPPIQVTGSTRQNTRTIRRPKKPHPTTPGSCERNARVRAKSNSKQNLTNPESFGIVGRRTAASK